MNDQNPVIVVQRQDTDAAGVDHDIADEAAVGGAHHRRPFRVAEQRRHGVGHRRQVFAVDEQSRAVRGERVWHPTDVAGDDGSSDGLGLDEHDAEGLDLPAAATFAGD